jgi:hypothetical protein
MNEEVTLTPWESRICAWTGKQRFLNAQEFDRDPGLGPSQESDHIRGAHCEFAASIMLNLYWRPNVGNVGGKRQRDVGGVVEVRSTVLETGRLIVKPKDDSDAPFVLIVADMEALRFRFGGWTFGRNAKERPLACEHGDPAHYVPQSKLWNMADLKFWLRATDE